MWRLETSAKNDIAEFASRRDADLEKLAVLTKQLQEPLQSWKASLPPTLDVDQAEGANPCVLRFVLRGRITYHQELVSWPFLHAAIHSAGNLPPVVDELAIGALHAHCNRITANRPGYYHRHHGTWLMIKTSARSACILLAAALTPSMAAYLPGTWNTDVCDTVDMLRYWNQRGAGLDSVAALLRNEVAKLKAGEASH